MEKANSVNDFINEIVNYFGRDFKFVKGSSVQSTIRQNFNQLLLIKNFRDHLLETMDAKIKEDALTVEDSKMIYNFLSERVTRGGVFPVDVFISSFSAPPDSKVEPIFYPDKDFLGDLKINEETRFKNRLFKKVYLNTNVEYPFIKWRTNNKMTNKTNYTDAILSMNTIQQIFQHTVLDDSLRDKFDIDQFTNKLDVMIRAIITNDSLNYPSIISSKDDESNKVFKTSEGFQTRTIFKTRSLDPIVYNIKKDALIRFSTSFPEIKELGLDYESVDFIAYPSLIIEKQSVKGFLDQQGTLGRMFNSKDEYLIILEKHREKVYKDLCEGVTKIRGLSESIEDIFIYRINLHFKFNIVFNHSDRTKNLYLINLLGHGFRHADPDSRDSQKEVNTGLIQDCNLGLMSLFYYFDISEGEETKFFQDYFMKYFKKNYEVDDFTYPSIKNKDIEEIVEIDNFIIKGNIFDKIEFITTEYTNLTKNFNQLNIAKNIKMDVISNILARFNTINFGDDSYEISLFSNKFLRCIGVNLEIIFSVYFETLNNHKVFENNYNIKFLMTMIAEDDLLIGLFYLKDSLINLPYLETKVDEETLSFIIYVKSFHRNVHNILNNDNTEEKKIIAMCAVQNYFSYKARMVHSDFDPFMVKLAETYNIDFNLIMQAVYKNKPEKTKSVTQIVRSI